MSKKNEIKVKGKIYISAKEAANITHYTSDYVGQLSRANKIGSTKIGHTRFVNKNELLRYTENGNKQKRSFREKEHLATQTGRDGKGETLNKGKQEYQTISTTKVTELDYFNEDVPLVPEIEKTKKQENEKSKKLEIKKSFSNIKSPFTSHSQFVSDLFFKKVLVFFLAISLTFGPYFLGTRTGIANAAYEGVVSVVKIAKEISREVYTRIDEKGPLVFIIDAVSDTKKIVKKEGFKLVASVPSSGLSFKGVAAKFYVAVNSLFESEGEIILVNEDSTEELNKLKEDLEILKNRKNISTKTIVVEAPGKIVERIIEKTSSNAITKNELEDRLQKLDNKLSAEIYTISAGSPLSVQTVYRAVSHTNKIDKLRNTDITTPTVVGGTISGVSITGATYEGSALTITGTADIGGSATITGDTTIGGQLFVSGTATSTIAGDVNFDSNTLYIDSVNNRIGIGTTTPQYTLDIDGTLNVSSIVTSGGQTTGGDFAVTGDTTLGNATSSDTTYFNSRIGTSLIPTSDNVLDLGGESDWLRWRAAILGTSLGIGGTATSTGVSLLSSGNYLIDSASGLSINTTNNATTTFGSGVVTVPNLTTTNLTATNATTTNATTTNLAVTNLTLYTAPTAPYFTATSTTATSTFAGGVTISGTLRAQGPVNQTALSVDRLDLGVQDGTPRMVFEDSGSPIWLIDNSVGRFRWYIPGIEQMNLETSSNNATLSLRDASTRKIQLNTAGNTYFNGGNVGINDTTPTYKLDVNGTGRFTGALTLDSTLGVTGATTLAGILDVTGLSTFSQASTTRFSIFDTLYVGGTATSTLTSTQLAFPGAGTIDSSSGTLTLNSTALDINNTGAITVGTNGSEQNITFETQNFDVNSTGTVTIDGTTFTYTPTDTYTVNATGAVSIDSLAGSTLSGAGINITSDGANAVTVTYASTGGTFELTDGTTRLSFADNGDSVLGDDTSTTQLDGSTITLSGNTVIVGTITQTITDNSADALDIQEGTNNYINITTTNGSESIAFGNTTTNPTFNFLGSGLVSGTNTTFTNATTTSATTTNIAITSDATFNNLTASRLLSLNSSGTVSNTDLNSWITGTSNQVTVTDDTDGTVTLSLPSQLSFTNASTTLLSVFNGFWAGATATTSISAGGDLTVGGGDIILGSTSIFSGGDTASLNNIDAIDATTETTIETAIDTLVNLTSASSLATVGALDSGSITSNFGTINTGTSNITTTGTISGGNLVATGTSATSTFAGGLAVETSGLVYDYSTGNVGIGTAAPGVGLHIEDNNMKITGFGGTQERIYLSGNSNNPYIELFDSGTTKAKINSSGYSYFNGGNVGIGTASPGAKLEVSGGDILVDVGQGLSFNYSTNVRNLINTDGTGNIDIGQTGTNLIPSISLKAGNAGFISLIPGGGEAVRVTTTGNVGIGTTAPTQILHTKVTSGTNFFRMDSGANIGYVFMDGTNIGLASDIGTTGLKFLVNRNAPDDSMVIDTSGNVGIGTTSPSAKLEIRQDSSNGVFANFSTYNVNRAAIRENNWNGVLSLYDSSGIEKVKIEGGYGVSYFNGGNVGIGTTTPSYLLDVDGDFRVGEAGNSDAFFVNATTGNVGIGTTTPSYLLDVDGDFRVGEAGNSDAFFVNATTGNVGIGTTSPGNKLDVFSTDAQIANFERTSGSNPSIRLTSGVNYAQLTYDATNNLLALGENNGLGAVNIKAGNVGIGTASPSQAQLVVNKDIAVGLNSEIGLSAVGSGSKTWIGSNRLRYNSGADTFARSSATEKGAMIVLDNESDIKFYNQNSVSQTGTYSLTPTMTLQGTGTAGGGGNVGIGTTAPDTTLVIENSAGGPASATYTTTAANAELQLSAVGVPIYNHLFMGVGDATYSWIQSQHGNSAGQNLALNPIGGNVGIGTTSPTRKLQVNGMIYANAGRNDTAGQLIGDYTGSDGYWNIRTSLTGSAFNLDMYNAGTWITPLTVQQDGNVGIGTTTPYSRLSIWGDGSNNIFEAVDNASSTKMVITNAGNVGIGTTTPTHLLTVGTASGGAVCVDNGAGGCNGASNIAGDIYYSAAHSSYTDIAEKYPSLENLEAGDIVSVDRERNIESKPYVKRATRQDTALLGVISTKPGLTLGDNYGKSEDYSVALSGRVPVKVSLENGKIEPGDRISLSAFLDGVGRKAGENESSVGISLGKFDNNSGENYISPLPETTDLVKIREIASEEFVIQAEANQIEVGSVLMFVDLDIRNGDDLIKNDIQYYDNLSYEKVLDVIGGVDVVTYVKKVGDEERQIDILEKNAPKEILSVSGGISMYKLTILNLAGVKALNIKLNNLEARVSALESVVGTGLQPVLGEEGNQSIFQAFLTYLEGLGVKITNGFATFKNLIASTLKVGTPEKPSGITLYDDVTGEPYCLKIANGAMVSNSGECEILDVADSNGGSVGVVGDTATTTPSGAPVITLNGLNPATIAISSSYSDMGIGVVDSVTGNELGYTTSVSGGFLSQPVEFASGMQISLDTATSTTYTITYTAVSQDGVEATAERIVVVGDGGSTPVDLTNSGSEAIATTTATTTNSGDGVNATTTPTTTATTTSP